MNNFCFNFNINSFRRSRSFLTQLKRFPKESRFSSGGRHVSNETFFSYFFYFFCFNKFFFCFWIFFGVKRFLVVFFYFFPFIWETWVKHGIQQKSQLVSSNRQNEKKNQKTKPRSSDHEHQHKSEITSRIEI